MAGVLRWLFRIACGVGGVAGLGLAVLYFFQEKLLYVPRIPGMPSGIWKYPNEFGLEYEDVEFASEDGTKLHGWLLWHKNLTPELRRTRPVIVFFQENAGNMSFRLPFLRLLVYRLNVVVFAPSYRGYGLSEGSPNQRGIQKDARAVLDLLRARQDLDTSKIVLMGRSLGGAVAIHLAAERQEQVKALVVENAFTGVEDMVARVVPPLSALIGSGRPCNFLVTNKWSNLAAIASIHTPLLMLVSLQDEMVPCWQMFKLHNAQRSRACTLVEFPNAYHMDAYDREPQLYWSTLKTFLDAHVEERQQQQPPPPPHQHALGVSANGAAAAAHYAAPQQHVELRR